MRRRQRGLVGRSRAASEPTVRRARRGVRGGASRTPAEERVALASTKTPEGNKWEGANESATMELLDQRRASGSTGAAGGDLAGVRLCTRRGTGVRGGGGE